MKKRTVTKEFTGFIFVGAIAASVNFLSRIIFNLWMNYSFSIILAYVTGMVTAFLLMKTFLFRSSKQGNITSIFFFTLVNVAAVFQTWAISIILQQYFLTQLGFTSHINEIAHFFGVIAPVFSSYIGHKYLSFR